LEDGLVFQAIIACEKAHQRTAGPIVKHPADIFPRHARHRGEVTLGDFLPHGDAAFAEVPAEKLWRLNGARDASPLIRRFQLRISGLFRSAPAVCH